MTAEKRAQQMLEDDTEYRQHPFKGKEELKALFVKHLRDQIEECAKVGDEQAAFHKAEAERLFRNESAALCERTGEHAAERIAARIRALAEPIEETKEKGN